MNKKDIQNSLKEILNVACELRLKKKVITLEEFEKITDKLYNMVDRLRKKVDNNENE